MRASILLLTTAVASACATSRTIEGRVDAVGTDVEPRTVITAEDADGPVFLVGDLESELRRASGAIVRVTGRPASGAPGEALRVDAYRLLEVDGERPWVGIVRAGEDGVALEPEDGEAGELHLIGLPTGAIGTGAKAWIVGRREGVELRVRSYGVLRPAGSN